MKQLVKISTIFLVLMINVLVQAQMSGHYTQETEPVAGRIESASIFYITDALSYTPGGLAFSYPVGLFSVAPCVFIRAEVTVPVADTAFIATISGNSVTGVTVTVYKLTATAGVPTAMIEASVGDNVTVYMYAVGA